MSKFLLKKFSFVVILLICFSLSCKASGESENDKDEDIYNDTNITFSDEFKSKSESWIDVERQSPNGIVFGATDANSTDGKSLQIRLPGKPDFTAEDVVGPTNGNTVESKEEMSYGRYLVRARAAGCDDGEEVVTGIFMYAYGGDENDNGITDNDEIDIEVACSSPNELMLTVWTDYEDHENFRKITRIVDMTTGNYYQTLPGKEGEFGVSSDVSGKIEGIADTSFDATKSYYEMGFEWDKDFVKFVFIKNSEEIVLWKMEDSLFVPNPRAKFVMNIWHPKSSWSSDDDADYPSKDAVVSVDWFKYWIKR